VTPNIAQAFSKWLFLCAFFLATSSLSTYAEERSAPDNRLFAPLLEGMGVYSRPISTDSIAAQRYFDQGIAYIHGYYFSQAAASFEQALVHDPDHPMLLWGLALASGPNPNSRAVGLPDDPKGFALQTIAKAKKLGAQLPAAEQALVGALQVRLDKQQIPDRGERDQAYISATEIAYRAYPNDPDLGFLLADAVMTKNAWSYWQNDLKPKPGIKLAMEALKNALKVHPLHPGANHLTIHLYEDEHPSRAVPSANRIASLIPSAGHIVHMPAHIFVRMGRFQEAIDTNLRSWEADQTAAQLWQGYDFPKYVTYPVSFKNHPSHATDFIRFSATFSGQYQLAIDYANKTEKIVSKSPRPGAGLKPMATVWLVEKIFGKWSNLIDDHTSEPEHPFLKGMWAYARGSALANTGQLDAARAALALIDEMQQVATLKLLMVRFNTASVVLNIARHGLAGEISLAAGDVDAAIGSFEQAVAAEDALKYIEPFDWPQPMRLFLGAALLTRGDAAAAEDVYRATLGRVRENGWALFGLQQALQAQGKAKQAADANRRFGQAWQKGEITLTRSAVLH